MIGHHLQPIYLITGQSKALRPPESDGYEGMIDGAAFCNCPLDCEETVYSQEISQAECFKKSEKYTSFSFLLQGTFHTRRNSVKISFFCITGLGLMANIT